VVPPKFMNAIDFSMLDYDPRKGSPRKAAVYCGKNVTLSV